MEKCNKAAFPNTVFSTRFVLAKNSPIRLVSVEYGCFWNMDICKIFWQGFSSVLSRCEYEVKKMIRLVVPWPPKELSPNARVHWRKKVPIKNKFKDACFYQAQQTNLPDHGGNIAVYISAFPKSNRHDLDNIAASLKYGLDAIAEAWEINDKRFRPITVDFGGIEKKSPRVEIFFDVHKNNT